MSSGRVLMQGRAAHLEVDGKGRDLLRERDEVDARVEKVGRKLGLEIDGNVRLPVAEKRVSTSAGGGENDQRTGHTARRGW